MLESFIDQISEELEILPKPMPDENNIYHLSITEDARVTVKELEPGISFYAQIAECPEEKKEDLFIYLMKANLFGQGTGGAAIGFDPDEKFLTLSLTLSYEMNYQHFKEKLEDFVNYLIYWKEEIDTFKKDAMESLL